jgi:hypothetical protein
VPGCVGKERGYFSNRHQLTAFFNRADGVNCAVRINSLNIVHVTFHLETGIPNSNNLVCSAGNLEAKYLTT